MTIEPGVRQARLSRLAEILGRVPNEVFNMWAWYTKAPDDDCGMAACAGGWAALDQGFRAAGLALEMSSSGDFMPTYKEHVGYAALAEFFHLALNETTWIFNPCRYGDCCDDPEEQPEITPQQVLTRLRWLLLTPSEDTKNLLLMEKEAHETAPAF
jgi:hypothetical protein